MSMLLRVSMGVVTIPKIFRTPTPNCNPLKKHTSIDRKMRLFMADIIWVIQ